VAFDPAESLFPSSSNACKVSSIRDRRVVSALACNNILRFDGSLEAYTRRTRPGNTASLKFWRVGLTPVPPISSRRIFRRVSPTFRSMDRNKEWTPRPFVTHRVRPYSFSSKCSTSSGEDESLGASGSTRSADDTESSVASPSTPQRRYVAIIMFLASIVNDLVLPALEASIEDTSVPDEDEPEL